MLGRLDEAEQAAHKVVELQPARASMTHGQLAVIEILRGDAKAALAEARQTQEADGFRDTCVAQALLIGSDRAAADAALKARIDTRASEVAYQIAEMYALRKDADNTFVWLDRALATRIRASKAWSPILCSSPAARPALCRAGAQAGVAGNHVYLDAERNDADFVILCGDGTFNQCRVAGALTGSASIGLLPICRPCSPK